MTSILNTLLFRCFRNTHQYMNKQVCFILIYHYIQYNQIFQNNTQNINDRILLTLNNFLHFYKLRIYHHINNKHYHFHHGSSQEYTHNLFMDPLSLKNINHNLKYHYRQNSLVGKQHINSYYFQKILKNINNCYLDLCFLYINYK